MQISHRIQELKRQIKSIEDEIRVLESVDGINEPIKRGDFVRMLETIDWGPSVGEIYWVDTVNETHILVRPKDPARRNSCLFWVGNHQWVKA